jgi:hypothetical protein
MAYTDPRAGLPLSPLMQRALGNTPTAPLAKPDVTEIRETVAAIVTKPVTKPTRVTKPKGGRPSAGDRPMTPAERVRAHRAKTKCQPKQN